MSMNSVSGLPGLANLQVGLGTLAGAVGGAGMGGEGGRMHGGHRARHPHGGMLQQVLQTLNQLGLGSAVPQSASSTPSEASASGTAPAAAGDARQAMHTFMHDLFQALNQAGPAGQAGAAAGGADGDGDGSSGQQASGAGSYASFSQQLGALLQGLNGASATGPVQGASSDLNSAFQNLVQALGAHQGANGSSSGSAQPVTLQAFLQDLMQNLQAAGTQAPNGVGAVVSTAA